MTLSEYLSAYLKRKKNLNMKVATATELPQIPKIPTGIFVFDYLTGGGIPVGKVTEFLGVYSSGKTLLSLVIADAFIQHTGKEVAFLDFEQSFDKKWAGKFVRDLNKLLVIIPPYGEAGLDILLTMIQDNAAPLYIVDSIAAITPIAEDEGSVEDMQVGLQARLMSKFFRKLFAAKAKLPDEAQPTLLMLNQVRSKMNVRAFAPTTSPAGGLAADYYAALIVRLYSKEFVKEGEVPIRQVFQMTVEKNKTGGVPKVSGEFQIWLLDKDGCSAGEPYEAATLARVGKDVGLLCKDGKAYSICGKSFTTLDGITEALKTDREFKSAFKEELYKCVFHARNADL